MGVPGILDQLSPGPASCADPSSASVAAHTATAQCTNQEVDLGTVRRVYHQLSGHESEQTLGDGEGRGAWHAAVHAVAKSQTRLNDSVAFTCVPPAPRALRDASVRWCVCVQLNAVLSYV